jgi:plasmid stability protein
MQVFTVRLPEEVEKKVRLKAKIEHRTLSEQIKKYLYDGILSEENDKLPLSFIKETLEAKAELEAGLGKEYKFGILK